MNILIDCSVCRHKYLGADGTDRCRAHRNGLACSPAAADGCKKFESDSDDGLVFMGEGIGWCVAQGRGD